MSWTVLPPQQPKQQNVLQSLLGGLVQGGSNAVQQLAAQKKEKDQEKKTQELFKSLGIETYGVKDPVVLKSILENQAEQKKIKKTEERNQETINGIEEARGLKKGSLKVFESNPALAASITKPKEPSVSNRSIDPEQMAKIKAVRAQPGYDTLDETGKYEALTDGGVSSSNSKDEAELTGQKLKRSTDEEKRKHESFIEDRNYHSKVSRPIVEEAQQFLKGSAIQEGLEQQLRRDIESGNTSGLFPFMVEKLGLESWRNPESARFTNAVKNLFTGSLKDIPGARPNQFIERFLATAQPMIGRSSEANLSVLDVSNFARDVKKEHARLELQLAQEDREKLGYAKEDISERAWNKMGDFANRRQEKMATQIRERHEKDMETSDLMSEVLNGDVPPDTPLTPKMMKIFYIKNDKNMDKAIAEAKKNNFVLPEYLE